MVVCTCQCISTWYYRLRGALTDVASQLLLCLICCTCTIHISGTDYVSIIYYSYIYESQLLLCVMFDCMGGWYLVGSIKRSCLAPFISNSSHLPRLNCINTHISTASLNTIICSLRLRGQNIPIALFKVTLRNTDTTMMHDATLPTANCSVGQDAGFVKSKLCKVLSCGW